MNFIDLRQVAENFGSDKLRALSETIWSDYEGRPWRSMTNYIGGEDSLGPFWVLILQNEPIGITGWFRADYLPQGSAGLRWTGIHPGYRGQGYFRASVFHVLNHVRTSAQEIQTITELAPARWAHQIVPAFQRLGFQVAEERHQTQGTDLLFEGAYVLIYRLNQEP